MANSTTCQSSPQAEQPACVPVMTSYCSISDPLGQTYLEKWQGDQVTSPCRKYVSLNPGVHSQYVPVVDAYVRRYLITDHTPITYSQEGSQIYDPNIEDVIQVCQDYPGGCDAVLTDVCSGYTRSDLGANPNLGILCGCFMASQQYDAYTGAFGVSKICDPACVLESAVKPADPSNQFVTLHCNQAICVIDNVTISILEKSTVGNISFGQACSSCSGNAGCSCNISDISITAVESAVQGISFSQNCGASQPNCFKSDANGIPRQVACSVLDTTSTSGSTSTNGTAVVIIVAIIVIVLILLFIIIFTALLSRKSKESALTYRGNPGYPAGPPPLSYAPAGFQGTGRLSSAPMI